MSRRIKSVRLVFIFVISMALLCFAPAGVAKKGGNGGGKPGGGDTPVSNVALLMAASGRNNRIHIYALNESGTSQQRLVSHASGFGGLAMPTVWSAQGDKIVWSQRESLSLHMVNDDGSGERIIVTADEHMQPWIGGQRNLAPAAYDCNGDSANLLYFLGAIIDDEWWHEEFYVMDLDSPSVPPIQLTDNQYERHTTLDVSPDGRFIATWTNDEPDDNWRSPDARFEIRAICQEENGLPVIASWTAEDLGLQTGYQYFARIDWSSNELLAISGHNTGGTMDDIYLIDLLSDPVTAVKLIGTGTDFGAGVDNLRPSWSPDGSHLAFSSDNKIYVLDSASGDITFIVDGVRIRDVDWRSTWVAEP